MGLKSFQRQLVSLSIKEAAKKNSTKKSIDDEITHDFQLFLRLHFALLLPVNKPKKWGREVGS